MQHVLQTPEPIELEVDLFDGLAPVRAENVTETTVTITGAQADQFRIEQSGRRVTVSGPRHRGWRLGRHQIRIVAPIGSDTAVRCGSASVELFGPLAEVALVCGSGKLYVERAGTVAATTGSGDIVVGRAAVARIKSGSGAVRIDAVAERAEVTCGSGNLAIGSACGSLVAKSGSGDLSIEVLAGDARFSTGSGHVSIERMARGRLDLTGGSGRVRVGVDKLVPVWTDITSISGKVISTLSPVGLPRPGQEHVEIRLHTVSGSVRLHPVDKGPQDAPVGAFPQDAPRGHGPAAVPTRG